MAKNVGRRPVKTTPAPRRREVSLFDFTDQAGDFDDNVAEDLTNTRRRARSVGDKRAPRKREVDLFNIGEDTGEFDHPF